METLQIAVLASALKIVVRRPIGLIGLIGLIGACNLLPRKISWPACALASICRLLHPVTVPILFEQAAGFRALASILALALAVASIGFIGRLLADAIEKSLCKQVGAVHTTDASFTRVVLSNVLPQGLPQCVGFSAHQLDVNLRNSTMVGIVGAGDVGGVLSAGIKRFSLGVVVTILLIIIAIIVVGERLANVVKKVFHV